MTAAWPFSYAASEVRPGKRPVVVSIAGAAFSGIYKHLQTQIGAAAAMIHRGHGAAQLPTCHLPMCVVNGRCGHQKARRVLVEAGSYMRVTPLWYLVLALALPFHYMNPKGAWRSLWQYMNAKVASVLWTEMAALSVFYANSFTIMGTRASGAQAVGHTISHVDAVKVALHSIGCKHIVAIFGDFRRPRGVADTALVQVLGVNESAVAAEPPSDPGLWLE